MNKSYTVHAPLITETIWVNRGVFFNLEKDNDKWEKVKLFGITCLTGKIPTFEIITQEGYVFSDIPLHLVRWKEKIDTKEYTLSSLVYNNCLSEEFVISQFPELQARFAYVFIKQTNEYVKGQYVFSLDFYKNNNWYHCMKLENGQFAFIPSHKIIFSQNEHTDMNQLKFPDFKKLRHEFKV